MATTLWRRGAVCVGISCTIVLFEVEAQAGVSYQDPAGGWRYKLEGNSAYFGPDGDTQALDGTWRHNQGDRWDGSAPGDTGPTPNGPAPGGIGQYTDGSTGYLRLQDSGNPETHGWLQGSQKSDDSNRRLNLAHQIDSDGALPSYLILDNGFTVSFRARIPNTGPLDPIYTQDSLGANVVLPWFPSPPADYNGNSTVDTTDYVLWRKGGTLQNEVSDPGTISPADYTEWRARFGNTSNVGRGYPLHDEGRGMFYIVQNDTNNFNLDSGIAFSLMTSVDAQNYCGGPGGTAANATLCALPKGGLVMNNLVSDSVNAQIDTFDAGTLNLLEIPDASLSDWHEFWITIDDTSLTTGDGTHVVEVYLDGSTTPTTFYVTATSDGTSAYLNNAWLAMGLSSSGLFGSVDVDFYAYSLGVITPVHAGLGSGSAVPEPSAIILLVLGVALVRTRGRLRS